MGDRIHGIALTFCDIKFKNKFKQNKNKSACSTINVTYTYR